MDSPNHVGAPVPQGSGSRPTIAFPLGTALLLLVIFSISGIFSFCYHWDTRRRSSSRRAAAAPDVGNLCKPQAAQDMNLMQPKNEGLQVVIMPGDHVPKFVALPSPCEPPRLEKIIVDATKPPQLQPPKLVPIALPVI